jgi:citrate lyase subunit beta / citryl-CoA lyase
MRPYRSMLFMPGHRPELVDKGIAAGADALVLDLEDAVPAAEKIAARRVVADSIARVRADGHRIGLFVRPNALDTRTTGSDLDVVVQPGLDGVFLSKVGSVADVHRCEALLDHAEHGSGAEGLEMIVPTETATAIRDVDVIAAASPRIGGLIGATARHADVARAVGFSWTPEGRESLYLRSRVLVAARAAGVHPITGLWEDVRDLDGLRRFAQDGRGLGFRGMILIHPAHVAVVNEVFTPTQEEAAFYRGLVAAFEEAEAAGRGALVYEGEHIDIAHVATARAWLAAYDELARL